MLGRLRDIFVGVFCKHNREFKGKRDVYDGDYSGRPYATKYLYICTKCMKFKKIKA